MKSHTDNSIYRILDAALNRAGEGLRVIEDYCRMHLEDGLLATTAKNLRHTLTRALSTVDSELLLRCRDTRNDPGVALKASTEYQRDDELNIIRANSARVQQALRTIEEYSKTIDAHIAHRVEQIRYTSYTLEKAIANTKQSQSNLNRACLYVLTDTCSNLEQFESMVGELVDAGVDLIQLRDKAINDRQLVEAGQLLSRLTQKSATRWIMNDRADLALLSGADGVHVGESDLSVAQVREIIGVEKIVGVTTHSIEQAREAVFDGASYIGFGPVFKSATKSFDSLAAEEFLRWVVNEISLPAFAIGGIEARNLEQLIDLGIRRVAVSNCVVNADSPADATRELKSRLLKQLSDPVT